MADTGTWRVKAGLAQMLKGGVIMDVVNADQARIAQEAGATSVMALERVPADIRAAGGVARMADPTKISEIMEAVSIPVMAKCRIGHFVEAQVLEAMGVDYVDESEVLTPADEAHHVWKHNFKVPFCLRLPQLGRGPEACRRGRRHDPHQGRGRHGRCGGSCPPYALGDGLHTPAPEHVGRGASPPPPKTWAWTWPCSWRPAPWEGFP